MSTKARMVRPVVMPVVMTLASILAACGGQAAPPYSGAATPKPVPISTPISPTANQALDAPLLYTPSSTLEEVAVRCADSPKNEILISVAGLAPLKIPVGNHIFEYSLRVAGVGLPRKGFECVNSFYDPMNKLVFVYGQDKSGRFPAELTVIDPKTMKEVGYLMHPGHIKGVVPVGKLDTPKGSIDALVVTAASNVPSLVNAASAATSSAQPYVPVAMAVNLKTMEVIGYLQLGNEGQPLFPAASRQDGRVIIAYSLDVGGKRVPAAFAVSQLFASPQLDMAERLSQAGLFK